LIAENCVTLSSDEDENSDISKTSTDASHKVVPGNYDILKSPSDLLNDRLINVGLALLKLKFPAVLGLEDVAFLKTRMHLMVISYKSLWGSLDLCD